MSASILIVEDEEPIQILLSYNFEAEGYRVRATAQGEDVGHPLARQRPCDDPTSVHSHACRPSYEPNSMSFTSGMRWRRNAPSFFFNRASICRTRSRVIPYSSPIVCNVSGSSSRMSASNRRS